MKETFETRVKEKMMDFSRRFEKHVALKEDEAPFDRRTDGSKSGRKG